MNAPHEEAVEFAKQSKRENRVYVGNLSYDVKYRDLMEFMRGGGLEDPRISFSIVQIRYGAAGAYWRRRVESDDDIESSLEARGYCWSRGAVKAASDFLGLLMELRVERMVIDRSFFFGIISG